MGRGNKPREDLPPLRRVRPLPEPPATLRNMQRDPKWVWLCCRCRDTLSANRQVLRVGNNLRGGSHGSRPHRGWRAGDGGSSLDLVREGQCVWPHRDGEDQICRFQTGHAQPIFVGSNHFRCRSAPGQPRPCADRVSARARCAPGRRGGFKLWRKSSDGARAVRSRPDGVSIKDRHALKSLNHMHTLGQAICAGV